MNKVYACIDGRTNTSAVTDASAWMAHRLACPLVVTHVIEPQSSMPIGADVTGLIGLSAPDALLQQMSTLEAQRHQIAEQAGWRIVQEAQTRASDAGIQKAESIVRHDTLVESVIQWQEDARVFVLGQHRHPDTQARRHLDHHIEQVVRTVTRTVMVVPCDVFHAPKEIVVAYDGSPTTQRLVERLSVSPFLGAMPVTVLMVAADTTETRETLLGARKKLEAGGRHVETLLSPGTPEDEILALVAQRPHSVLAIGAYGHSRIRELIVGSTTTTLLRLSPVPVLVLR